MSARDPRSRKDRKPQDESPTLPESTRDDTDEGWGDRPRRDDEWLRDQRPPHWDPREG
jgi:hypothetical protein